MEQIVNGLKCDTDAAARVQGGTGANQYTEQRGNNFPSAKTAEKIGERFNVSDRTVKNAPEWSGPEWVTARISRSRWEADHAWQEKNPEGRRVAIWYPRGGRVDLIRHSGPGYIEHPGGEEVEYPDLDQPTTRAVHTDPGPAVTVKLEWVE